MFKDILNIRGTPYPPGSDLHVNCGSLPQYEYVWLSGPCRWFL